MSEVQDEIKSAINCLLKSMIEKQFADELHERVQDILDAMRTKFRGSIDITMLTDGADGRSIILKIGPKL